MFVKCEICGKKLLQRLPNGLWQFRFGSDYNGGPLIDMQVVGSIKMKCIRRECGHINTLNYFPNTTVIQADGNVTKE